jgi:hypothetical protein
VEYTKWETVNCEDCALKSCVRRVRVATVSKKSEQRKEEKGKKK